MVAFPAALAGKEATAGRAAETALMVVATVALVEMAEKAFL